MVLKKISRLLSDLFDNFNQADDVVDEALKLLRLNLRTRYRVKCYEVFAFLEALDPLSGKKYRERLGEARENMEIKLGNIEAKQDDLKHRLITLDHDRDEIRAEMERLVEGYKLTGPTRRKLRQLADIGEEIETIGFTPQDITKWGAVVKRLDAIGFETTPRR